MVWKPQFSLRKLWTPTCQLSFDTIFLCWIPEFGRSDSLRTFRSAKRRFWTSLLWFQTHYWINNLILQITIPQSYISHILLITELKSLHMDSLDLVSKTSGSIILTSLIKLEIGMARRMGSVMWLTSLIFLPFGFLLSSWVSLFFYSAGCFLEQQKLGSRGFFFSDYIIIR